MPSRLERKWQSDSDYVAAQDRISSWSHLSPWGEQAAKKFVMYGRYLGDRLYHDDVVADFGGNDGTAAHRFFLAHGIKPIVIDCEPKRLEYARSEYGLVTVETFLESMPMIADKSIDWGFSSHTLEHVRDQRQAICEILRVVKRGCGFIIPLENHGHAEENEAHTFHCTTVKGWRHLIESCGWRVEESSKQKRPEAHIFAVPA